MRTFALLLTFSLGCATSPTRPTDGRAELISVERQFAHTSLEKGAAQAFAENLATDAVELGSGPAKRGRDAIVAALTPEPGHAFSLSWEPEDAAVAGSGDLGYTWGHYTLTVSPDGKPPVTEHGKYMTVWRRDPATKRWEVIADVGHPD